MNCEQCRDQLLPFLYDLLEPHERAVTTAHLESCADCQGALKAARDQQGMLAEAVKQQHPDIIFKAPSKVTPASTAPTILMQRPPRRPRWLNRWAAAAAILLVLGGAATAMIWRSQTALFESSRNRLARAKDDLAKSQDALSHKKSQTQKEIRAIQDQIDTLVNKWKNEEVKTRKVLEGKGAQLIITGPQVPLAGAPNRYEIEWRQDGANYAQNQKFNNKDAAKGGGKGINEKDTQDVKQQPNLPGSLPTKALQVRAINKTTNKEVYKQDLNLQANNNAKFVLPSDLSIKPGDDIVIEFQAPTADGKLVTLIDKLKLVFPEYVTHLATDRPLYRPGETVRFRSLTLERFSLKPSQQKFDLRYRIVGPKNESIYAQEVASQVVLGPKNEPIKGPGGMEIHCIGAGEFTLPEKLADGQYTLIVNEVNERFNEEKRTFLIHSGQTPGITKADRPIPLVTGDMQVEFYPEGGDLIAGVPNRIYFQARTSANKPVKFAGRIVDEANQEVAHVQTLSDDKEPGINQGLGAFTFTPLPQKTYRLRVESPIGIETPFKLPDVKQEGVVLKLPQAVADKEILVDLNNVGKPRELLIGAYCRGRMMDHKFVKAGAQGSTRVTLRPMAGVGGVYRITVFEKALVDGEMVFRPLAERLIYRKSAERVDVAITSDRAGYQPGDPVRLSLWARNEKKMSVPAIAMIAVVDSSILNLADEKTTRGLATHFLLTTEVRNPEDLEYADVLLGNHPKASVALDLLLGCQGWRRFAEQDPLKFQLTQKQEFARGQQQPSQRNFLANSIVVPQLLDAEQKHLEEIDHTFVEKAIKLEEELAKTEKQEAGPPELQQAVEVKQSSVEAVELAVWEADRRLNEIRAFLVQFALGVGMLALLAVSFLCISVGLRRLSDGTGNDRGWLGSGLALLGVLFLISIVGTFVFRGENLLDHDRPKAFRQQRNAPVALKADLGKPEPMPVAIEPREIILAAESEAELKKLKAPIEEAKKALPPPAGFRVEAKALVAAMPQLPDQAGLEEQIDRELRQQGNYQALLRRHMGRRVQLPPAQDPSVVRIYAHQHKPDGDAVRRDTAATVYWHPVLVMPDGKAEVTFDLSDSVTRFQVLVMTHTLDGRLGTNRVEITSKLRP